MSLNANEPNAYMIKKIKVCLVFKNYDILFIKRMHTSFLMNYIKIYIPLYTYWFIVYTSCNTDYLSVNDSFKLGNNIYQRTNSSKPKRFIAIYSL